MHIADLSTDCYVASGSKLRSIGWLEAGHDYPIGDTPAEFRDCLREHLANPFSVISFMGSHQCSLCPSQTGPLGNGELLIPTNKLCYVAPVMLYHYIAVHRYKPPQEFVDAVILCPAQQSAEYQVSIEPFLPVLAGQA